MVGEHWGHRPGEVPPISIRLFRLNASRTVPPVHGYPTKARTDACHPHYLRPEMTQGGGGWVGSGRWPGRVWFGSGPGFGTIPGRPSLCGTAGWRVALLTDSRGAKGCFQITGENGCPAHEALVLVCCNLPTIEPGYHFYRSSPGDGTAPDEPVFRYTEGNDIFQ